MKVLIVGQAKTGTTALLFGLKDALGIEHYVSEPEQLGFEGEYDDVIVKYFVRGDEGAHIGKYDKVVILVRNGYDTLISHLLFQPRAHLHRKTEREFRSYLRLVCDVRQGRAGIVTLARRFQELTGVDVIAAAAAYQERLLTFRAAAEANSVVLKYEDFVDGRLADLERYLDIPVGAASEINLPSYLSYVTRSRRADNWRGWILPEDMDALAPVFAPFHDALGYRFDRKLLRTVEIAPDEGEDYVLRIVRQRQRKAGRFWRLKRMYRRWRGGAAHQTAEPGSPRI